MSNSLTANDRHMLRLIERSPKNKGWAFCSATVWPLVVKMPRELVELEEVATGGVVKLTQEGETVLKWLL